MKIQQSRQFLKSFLEQCYRQDSRWIKRTRFFTTVSMLQLLISQSWLLRARGAKTVLFHLQAATGATRMPSASAFCQARQRLHWSLLRALFHFLVHWHTTHMPQSLWRGRRIFAFDTTKLNLPPACKKQKYIRPTRRSHYPQALLTVLYQLRAGIAHHAQLCRHFDERRSIQTGLTRLQPGDVTVMDRGFFLFPLSLRFCLGKLTL